MPNRAELWDFLAGLKETTERGFSRIETQFQGQLLGLESRLSIQIDGLEARMGSIEGRMDSMERRMDSMERRLVRIDDRLAGIENLNVGTTLIDHELRLKHLEHRDA